MSGFVICGNVYGARRVEHDDIHSACEAREDALWVKLTDQRARIEQQGVQNRAMRAHMQQQGELAEQQKALAEQQKALAEQQGDQLQHQQAQIADQQAHLEEMSEEKTLYLELIEMLKEEIKALNSLIPEG